MIIEEGMEEGEMKRGWEEEGSKEGRLLRQQDLHKCFKNQKRNKNIY